MSSFAGVDVCHARGRGGRQQAVTANGINRLVSIDPVEELSEAHAFLPNHFGGTPYLGNTQSITEQPKNGLPPDCAIF